MARVTVTIEGDIDEVMATVQGMAGAGSGVNTARRYAEPAAAVAEAEPEFQTATAVAEAPTAVAAAPEREIPPAPEETAWNVSYVHTFWRNLSDTARQAMVRVSRSPNHMQKRAQLMHTLQLSQRELSGSLSSQGHSLNRLKRRRGDVNLPRPLTYDKVDDVYALDANFAEAMRELGLS